MYLPAVVAQKVPLSTYFVATLEGVGGGGATQKLTPNKIKKLNVANVAFF